MSPPLPPRTSPPAFDTRGRRGTTLACLLTACLLLPACQKQQTAEPAAAPPAASAVAERPVDPAPRVADDGAANPDRSPPADAADAPPAVSTPARKDEVVKIINSIPIAFDAGAGTVSADSLDGVAKAARALASTPDLRVQIGLAGDGNDALARQRVEALKVQLIINGVSPGAIGTKVLPGASGEGANTVSFSSESGAAP